MKSGVAFIVLAWLTNHNNIVDTTDSTTDDMVKLTDSVVDTTDSTTYNMNKLTASDFEMVLLEKNNAFVDKTMMLVALQPLHIVLIVRGRMFGKTFNLQMLRVFYDVFHDSNGNILSSKQKQRSSYFEGGHYRHKTLTGRTKELNLKPLKISAHDNVMMEMGNHPVIYITFMNMGICNSYDEFMNRMKKTIVLKIDKCKKFLLKVCDDDVFIQGDGEEVGATHCLKLFTNSTEALEDPFILEHSIYILSAALHTFFREEVVILIDEYDYPIHNMMKNQTELSKVVLFMYKFFTNTFKKGSSFIHKGVLTGLLCAKNWFFGSGMNNIHEDTIFDPYLADYFGFTQNEVELLLEKSDIRSVTIKQLEHWYDGFFTGGNKVYNPVSVQQCLINNGRYGQYWISTEPMGSNQPSSDCGLNEFILPTHSLFTEGLFLMDCYQEILQQLLCNYTRQVDIKRKIPINMELSNDEYLSCLTLLGYLTAYQTNFGTYMVEVPNLEIRDFLRIQAKLWSSKKLGKENIARIGQLEKINITNSVPEIRDFLIKTLPQIKLPEKNYCDVFFASLLSLSHTWELHRTFSELHSFDDIECLITIIPLINNQNRNLITISVGSGTTTRAKRIMNQVKGFLKRTGIPLMSELCNETSIYDILYFIPKKWRYFGPVVKIVGKFLLGRFLSSTDDLPVNVAEVQNPEAVIEKKDFSFY